MDWYCIKVAPQVISLSKSLPSCADPIWAPSAEFPFDYMARSKATAAKSKGGRSRPERPSSSGASNSRGGSRGSSWDREEGRDTRDEPQGAVGCGKQGGKGLVGNYDLSDLPGEWDQSSDIRQRMRHDKNLVVAYDNDGNVSNDFVTATSQHVKLNSCVLRPIAQKMCENGLLLPAIDRLILAIEEYYVLAKRHIGHEKAYHEAWAIRRLIGKLKRHVYRKAPPEDCTWLHGLSKNWVIKNCNWWVMGFFDQNGIYTYNYHYIYKYIYKYIDVSFIQCPL